MPTLVALVATLLFSGANAAQAQKTTARAAQPTPRGTVKAAALQVKANMPRSVRLGTMTIDRYHDVRVRPSLIAKSIFAPIATPEFAGVVKNLNGSSMTARLPTRFIIGDGGHTRAFIGIDTTAGSPLDKALGNIVRQISTRPDGTHDSAVVVEFLRTNVNQLIKWTRGSSANDGRAEFSWDLALKVDAHAHKALEGVAYDPVGGHAKDAGQHFAVVPFEKYLEKGEGYCIQKAILASLVLDRLKIDHKLVNGAVLQGPGRSTGHSWIELANGKVFDPAWGKVADKGPASTHVKGAYGFGGSERMDNEYYPALVSSE